MKMPLAVVKQIYLYPVKGMRGTAVSQAHVGLNGLTGDRRYAFARQSHAGTNGFPWATGRNEPKMILYEPRFVRVPTENDPDPPIRVTTPQDSEFDVHDAGLQESVAREHREPVFLFKTSRGNFDSQHLSLFSLATARALAGESGYALDPRQFRANLYIEPLNGKAFIEEEWVGRTLQVGTARVGVTKKDTRCMMINLDPNTAIQHPEVLRTVTRAHNVQAGIYANVIAPGIVAVGDELSLSS